MACCWENFCFVVVAVCTISTLFAYCCACWSKCFCPCAKVVTKGIYIIIFVCIATFTTCVGCVSLIFTCWRCYYCFVVVTKGFAFGFTTYTTCLWCCAVCCYPAVTKGFAFGCATCTTCLWCCACCIGPIVTSGAVFVSNCICYIATITFRCLCTICCTCCIAVRYIVCKAVSKFLYLAIYVTITTSCTCVGCVSLFCACWSGYY